MKKNLLKKMWISITMLMLFSTAAVAQVVYCDTQLDSSTGDETISISCYYSYDYGGYCMKLVSDNGFDITSNPFPSGTAQNRRFLFQVIVR